MKIIAIIVVALTLVFSASAQTAKVIPLSDADTATIKALYAEQEAINKKIEDFRSHVYEVYTTTSATTGTCYAMLHITSRLVKCSKLGWQYGFNYSDDFKYIVPGITDSGNHEAVIKRGIGGNYSYCFDSACSPIMSPTGVTD